MIRSAIFWFVIFSGAAIALVYPYAGLMVYLFVTHSGFTGFVWYPAYYYGMVLGGAILVGFAFRESGTLFRGLAQSWLLIALWLWIALASFFALSREYSMPALYDVSRMMIMVIILVAMTTTEKRAEWALKTVAAALGLLGLRYGYSMIHGGGAWVLRGPSATFADENDFATVLDMGFVFLWSMSYVQSNRWLRWGYRAMSLASAVAAVGTRSRAGFLGLVVGALLLALFARRKTFAIPALILGVLLFFAFVPQAAMERYSTISGAAETDGSAIGRLEAWQTAGRMMAAHPILGVGPKNFYPMFSSFSGFHARNAHNIFLLYAAECGIPALLMFLTLVGIIVVSLLRVRRKLLLHDPTSTLAGGCLAVSLTLIEFMVPGFFNNMHLFDLTYTLIGIGLALRVVGAEKVAKAEEEVASRPDRLSEQSAVPALTI